MLDWIERAVIGLNLCPFAKGVLHRGQLRLVVDFSRADTQQLERVEAELRLLEATPAQSIDTTVLVFPEGPAEFLLFHDLWRRADRLLRQLRLEGVIQMAAFHPRWEFADLAPEDIANATNRAPHPALHLLREGSVARAVASGADAARITASNIDTMRRLGPQGWAALGFDAR